MIESKLGRRNKRINNNVKIDNKNFKNYPVDPFKQTNQVKLVAWRLMRCLENENKIGTIQKIDGNVVVKRIIK